MAQCRVEWLSDSLFAHLPHDTALHGLGGRVRAAARDWTGATHPIVDGCPMYMETSRPQLSRSVIAGPVARRIVNELVRLEGMFMEMPTDGIGSACFLGPWFCRFAPSLI